MDIFSFETLLDKMTWCKNCHASLCVTVLVVAAHLSITQATWMNIAMSSIGLDSHDTGQCSLVDGLVLEQTRICEANPETMPCVGLGVMLALSECKYQFEFEQWNCSSINGYTPQPLLIKGTKETAFTYAVTSAGVAHAVTAACSAGNLTECTCDMSRQGLDTAEGWRWGGCSDNVDYGVYFARTFIDAPDRVKRSNNPKDPTAVMNLHNNDVGRRAVSESLNHKCRCHGVSGSCATKTCWNAMASFRQVGDVLKARYANSLELSRRDIRVLAMDSNIRTRRKAPAVGENDLVFFKRSPDYCRPSRKRGIVGTQGRECLMGTNGPESCDELCCRRGYFARTVRKNERCNCKFLWCCEVVCQVCETVTTHYYCK